MSINPENLVKIGLVVSEIYLLKAIVRKEERIGKKVTEALVLHYTNQPAETWRANNANASVVVSCASGRFTKAQKRNYFHTDSAKATT